MLREKLKRYSIVLASGSPRRKKFFEDLGLNFTIRLKEIEEVYPPFLQASEIPIYLAELKAAAFKSELKPNELLITSDTIVWHNGTCVGKPADAEEAERMLHGFSGQSHEVISAVSFTTPSRQLTVHNSTEVRFKALSEEEIGYYVSTYKPFDKAGGYGIQEWIGLIGIEEIKGSYYNVMGLPTHLVYKTLMDMAGWCILGNFKQNLVLW